MISSRSAFGVIGRQPDIVSMNGGNCMLGLKGPVGQRGGCDMGLVPLFIVHKTSHGPLFSPV